MAYTGMTTETVTITGHNGKHLDMQLTAAAAA